MINASMKGYAHHSVDEFFEKFVCPLFEAFEWLLWEEEEAEEVAHSEEEPDETGQ